jgi:allantoinase
MPLNSIPPVTNGEGLRMKIDAASDQCWIDVGFLGGLVPGNIQELRPLHEQGVLGFKCFLVHSGVDEFPCVTEADLRPAMAELASLGAVLLAHAEHPQANNNVPKLQPSMERQYSVYLQSRPQEMEDKAVALLIRLCRETGCPVHIVHLSSASVLGQLQEAKGKGLPITVETCPHYLFFSAEDVAPGATVFKCAPPIRNGENREKLWQAINEGLIDLLASDHSPCPATLKRFESGSFFEAWGGVSSLQLSLSAVWTAASARGQPLQRLATWMAGAPARLAGLGSRKGTIDVGFDADLVVFDPEAEFRVTANGRIEAPGEKPALLSRIHHRHSVTPYVGYSLRGIVRATYLRGEQVFDGTGFSAKPAGVLLLRRTKS